mmetsp:Transcript_99616/g.177337  ORF Transcript_99616/g.177337 Transcript_99616/m.177337 type:complete len:628 (-) Transcript_99616:563-2446(-)
MAFGGRGTSIIFVCLLMSARADLWKPLALPYEELNNDYYFANNLMNAMMEGLEEDGVVAITGIPGFSELRSEVLRGAHACISSSPLAQSTKFPDGTLRRTLAGASIEGKQQGIDHGSTSLACRDWQQTSSEFRRMVAASVDLFVKRLGNGLNINAVQLNSLPGHSYDTLDDFASFGERLEHFHTYNAEAKQGSEVTIDYHVDQGLFIAFVPAMLLDDALNPAALPQGVFIETKDGLHQRELNFEDDLDALVIMLGDGVSQYLNSPASLRLHAPSHAFQMSPVGAGLHRVWYGLMQLPPSDAYNPLKELSFGEIRSQVIADPSQSALGCAKHRIARELSQTCSDNQIYCWFRCMDFTETVSPDYCGSQNSGFNCTNQFDQIYIEGHGDYFPACTNSTELETPRPPVTQPLDWACPEFDTHVSDDYYAHREELVSAETFFLWNILGGRLEGKMITRGLVGWMAIGIENINGRHNGMNGGRVVMGLNDPSTYPTIGEYLIHEYSSAFRHWKKPLADSALENASMELSSCCTSLQFTTATIYETPLNLTGGSNRLIWALSQLAYPTSDFGGYAPYHADPIKSPNNKERFRGHFYLTTDDGAGDSESGGAVATCNKHAAFVGFAAAAFTVLI